MYSRYLSFLIIPDHHLPSVVSPERSLYHTHNATRKFHAWSNLAPDVPALTSFLRGIFPRAGDGGERKKKKKLELMQVGGCRVRLG